LRQLLDNVGRLKAAHIYLGTMARDASDQPFSPGYEADLWTLEGGRFRIQFSDMWGDLRLLVCDGKTLEVDDGDDSRFVTLKDSPKTLVDADSSLLSHGDHGNPFFYALQGTAAFDKLVSKDSSITKTDDGNGRVALRFDSTDFGGTTIYYKDGRDPLPLRIEYDNLPYLKQQYSMFPEFSDEPRDPMTELEIRYISLTSPDKWTFDTTVAKGRFVQDLRSKKASGGG
jgi:hypothetical protein